MMHCIRPSLGDLGVSPSDSDADFLPAPLAAIGWQTKIPKGPIIATVVILQHELHRNERPSYIVHALAAYWHKRGHRVVEHFGTDDPPPGDVAVLHVDLTVVPQAYHSLRSRYRRVINGAVTDASRRRYSEGLLTRESDWGGPVIVKTDANCGGLPEVSLRLLAKKAGIDPCIPDTPLIKDYEVFESVSAVPPAIWNMPAFIVEKFLPEPHRHGFYLRNWLFLGNREVSYGGHCATPVMKLRDLRDVAPVPVPDEIRGWRASLGCDFGSFDYVRHADRYILFDVNRTPGLGPTSRVRLGPSLEALAVGLDSFL